MGTIGDMHSKDCRARSSSQILSKCHFHYQLWCH